ncbi:MAG: carbohydrate porin [Zoogloea sp.]|nr:carbohydrate porin [Zoogloea sp.]
MPLACLLASAPALAAPTQAELMQLLEKLNARVDRLEKRNAELEGQLKGGQPAQPALEQRVKTLEEEQSRLTKGMESEEISEKEPEITARLKAIEYQALGMLKAARTVESLEGITAGISLTTVAQRPSGVPGSSPLAASDPSSLTTSQLNYRGDVYVTLPLDNIGDTESRVFAQFRFGQGSGLNGLSTYSRPNASAFRVLSSQPDDSVAILGQAWYQATIPLPFGGYKPRSREKLEVNFGKMDPFVFFDQNAAANDETRQFLNTIFVHNPLLDAGGDIGVDANGFAPGFRMSYFNEQQRPENWRLSVGVFGAGSNGASYQRSFSSPMVITQAETQQKFFDGLTGNYRIYYWTNGQAVSALDSMLTERHSGWGLSADQRVGDAVTLTGRYGHQVAGRVRFDRAATLGAEVGGQYWERSGDSLGLAFGWLRTSSEYRDATAADPTLAGYGAMGGERVAEVYYRYRINKQFELSPDIQYIGRPGGNADASAIKMLGVRAQITY